MHILIVDDEPSDVELFEKAIRIMGHTAVPFSTLASAETYLQQAGTPADLMYLDNHFRASQGGGSGVYKIKDFRKCRPSLTIVVTTNQHLTPDIVQEVLTERVGFFVKPTSGTRRIEADIAQRMAAFAAERERTAALLDAIRKGGETGREGVARFLPFLHKNVKGPGISLVELVKTNETRVIPGFWRYATIAGLGQKIEQEQSAEVETAQNLALKASTEFGIGLSISESVPFFASKIGAKIEKKICGSVIAREERKTTLRSVHKEVLQLTESEYNAGIARKEFYKGMEHEVWRARLLMNCCRCALKHEVVLGVYAPRGPVCAAVSYDNYGRIVADGRTAYAVREI